MPWETWEKVLFSWKVRFSTRVPKSVDTVKLSPSLDTTWVTLTSDRICWRMASGRSDGDKDGVLGVSGGGRGKSAPGGGGGGGAGWEEEGGNKNGRRGTVSWLCFTDI